MLGRPIGRSHECGVSLRARGTIMPYIRNQGQSRIVFCRPYVSEDFVRRLPTAEITGRYSPLRSTLGILNSVARQCRNWESDLARIAAGLKRHVNRQGGGWGGGKSEGGAAILSPLPGRCLIPAAPSLTIARMATPSAGISDELGDDSMKSRRSSELKKFRTNLRTTRERIDRRISILSYITNKALTKPLELFTITEGRGSCRASSCRGCYSLYRRVAFCVVACGCRISCKMEDN